MIVCNDAWVPAIPEIPPFTLITKSNQTQGKALELAGLDMNPKISKRKKPVKAVKYLLLSHFLTSFRGTSV